MKCSAPTTARTRIAIPGSDQERESSVFHDCTYLYLDSVLRNSRSRGADRSPLVDNGGPYWIRTSDHLIKSLNLISGY